MSAAYISSQEYPSQEYIEFSIEAAKDGKNKELETIYSSFTPLHNLSHGKVVKRSDNGELWHINPDNTIARRITEERLHLFLNWDRRILLPDDILFGKLKAIGGLPASEYSLSPDFIQFPCKVKTANAEIIDLCLLHFSAAPPYQTYFRRILLLDEIIEIEPSELTLAFELRMESMLVDEIRMSFYPFMVKTISGELLLYDGTTQFVSKGEVKGSDIECQVPFSHDAKYKVVDVSFNDITYVIGKWDSRFDELFAKYRAMLNNYKAASTERLESKTDKYVPSNTIFKQLWNWLMGK